MKTRRQIVALYRRGMRTLTDARASNYMRIKLLNMYPPPAGTRIPRSLRRLFGGRGRI